MEYILRYLPIAKQDLSDAISFIVNEFQNPIAAENILNKIEQWNEHSSNINARLWELFQLAIDFAGCEAPFCVL